MTQNNDLLLFSYHVDQRELPSLKSNNC